MGARKDRKGLLFALPALALLGFSIVLPFVFAAVMTLTDQRMLSPNPTEFIGLDNYRRLLSIRVQSVPAVRNDVGELVRDDNGDLRYGPAPAASMAPSVDRLPPYQELGAFHFRSKRYLVQVRDPIFWKALANTFLFVLLVVPFQLGAALGLALLVKGPIAGRTAFRTFFFAPVVTSMVVVSIVWTFLYNENSGLINQILGVLAGGGVVAISWLGNESLALPALAFMSAWQGAGFQMIIILAGLQSIDEQLYEAARLDGASGWQQFRHVTLPGLSNTLAFVVVATTIAAFSLFVQVDVMTQGGPQDATTTLIYHAVQSGFREQDVAYGASVAVVYFLLVLSIALIQRQIASSPEDKS